MNDLQASLENVRRWLFPQLAERDSITRAITLAILGAVLVYIRSLLIDTRKDHLARINTQLEKFYGRLYVTSQAIDVLWQKFIDTYGICVIKTKNKVYFDDDLTSLTPERIAIRRRWITDTLLPLNATLLKVLPDRADLSEGFAFPASFIDLIAHVYGYEIKSKLWNEREPTTVEELTSFDNYPEAFNRDTETAYLRLKRRQRYLLRWFFFFLWPFL